MRKRKFSKNEIEDFVKNSNMITDNIALCVMDENVYKKYMLALISEDLLQFDKV